tara:strand:+ start:81 stop:734 length:654 start_codon:yes stop_codon:yes gene_type:complete
VSGDRVDLARIEAAVAEILAALGEDTDRDGLRDTPARVARMYAEVCCGADSDPTEHLIRTFDVDHDEMVMVRDIPVYSLCENHLLPFLGRAHVAYIPSRTGVVTGLSKLARLVDGYARRLQVQERLTSQIADAIDETLHPQGTLGGGRGRAPLHVHAGCGEARRDDHHVGSARPVQGRHVHPPGGHEVHRVRPTLRSRRRPCHLLRGNMEITDRGWN